MVSANSCWSIAGPLFVHIPISNPDFGSSVNGLFLQLDCLAALQMFCLAHRWPVRSTLRVGSEAVKEITVRRVLLESFLNTMLEYIPATSTKSTKLDPSRLNL